MIPQKASPLYFPPPHYIQEEEGTGLKANLLRMTVLTNSERIKGQTR